MEIRWIISGLIIQETEEDLNNPDYFSNSPWTEAVDEDEEWIIWGGIKEIPEKERELYVWFEKEDRKHLVRLYYWENKEKYFIAPKTWLKIIKK